MSQKAVRQKSNRPGKREPRRIQSIEVGFHLLRVIEAAEGFLPLTTLAKLAHMSPSKAYVYLASFVHAGLIRQDPATGRYGLGTFAAELGFAALRQMDVINFSREELLQLREKTGFAAHIAVWGDRGPTLAVKVDGQHQGSMMVRLGHVFSLRYTATGRVFLAYLPTAVTAPIVELEKAFGLEHRPRFPRSHPFTKAHLKQIRERGYASSEYASTQGFFGISVPIFDFSGDLVAALTLFGPSHRMPPASVPRFADDLKQAANRISLSLGGGRSTNGMSRTNSERKTTRSRNGTLGV